MEKRERIGHAGQIADLDRCERLAKGLGWVLSSYARIHGDMLDVRIVRGVDGHNNPTVEVLIGGRQPEEVTEAMAPIDRLAPYRADD